MNDLKDFQPVQRSNSYIFMAMFVLVIMVVVSTVPTEDVRLSFGQITAMNTHWSVTVLGTETEPDTLPAVIDAAPGETVVLRRILPDAFRNRQTIRLRSSMQDIQVYLDGLQIYDNTIYKQDTIPYSVEASVWILLDLPEESQGKAMEIHVASDAGMMAGRLNGIYYGDRGDLIADLLLGQMGTLLVAVFVFGVALFTFLMSLAVNRHGIRRLNYLSIFSLTVGIWLISEIDVMQLFSGNSYYVGSISYLMLPVAIIAFLKYMEEAVLYAYDGILMKVRWAFGGYLTVSMALQLVFGIDYIRIWSVFIVMLLLTILLVTGLLLNEMVRYENRASMKYTIYISALVLTTVLETIMFLQGDFMNVSSMSNMGIGLFLLLLAMDTVLYINGVMKQEGESRYLREVAFKDPLTKGFNRAAFERDIDTLLAGEEQNPFRLTMFDLNNLKEINDKEGHQAGDQALMEFFSCLTYVFDGDATCYRIGGDEFMVISENISESDHDAAINGLRQCIEDRGKLNGYDLQAAYGSDVYLHDISFGEFRHRVDMKMYQEKNSFKGA